MYQLISLICFALAIWLQRPSLQPSHPLVQPIIFYFYGLTAAILALLTDSSWSFVYTFRYFIYLISGILMVFIPVLLLALAALMWSQFRQRPYKSVGMRFFQLVMIVTFVLLFIATLWALAQRRTVDLTSWMNLYTLYASYFIATFLTFIILSLVFYFLPAKRSYPYLLVLGTEVDDDGQVSQVLEERLKKAIEFYQASDEKLQIILSGGYTSSVHYSEASTMATYLMSQGIPAEAIMIEDQALNTNENFAYLVELIPPQAGVSVVTSSFHLLRSLYFAQVHQVKLQVIGAKSPRVQLPYAVVREYIAFIVITQVYNYFFLILLTLVNLSWIFEVY